MPELTGGGAAAPDGPGDPGAEAVHRVLVGGTGSGKKRVAAALFRRHGQRLLAMDSMKVYRGMDVGTDKPPPELVRETDWRLLDLVGHDESFTSGRWLEAAKAEVEQAAADGAPVLFAGGTPLYLRLLLEGLCPSPPADEALRAELDARWEAEGEAALRAELAARDPELDARLLPGDRKRVLRGLEVALLSGRALSDWQREETRPVIPGRFLVAALRRERESHDDALAARVARMFDEGLVEEVEGLRARAPFAPEPARAIGYAETLELLDGTLDRPAAEARIVQRSRRLVRKQGTFLRSFAAVRWVDVAADADEATVVAEVERALEL